MFRFLQLMLCLFAAASAFEVPMTRRGLMSPLAAVAPAFADADNRMYTLVPRAPTEQITGADKFDGKPVGLGLTTDPVWGSAVKKGSELGDAKTAANYDKSNKGIKMPEEVRSKAMARLMAK